MKNLILILLLFFSSNVYSQTYQDTICWVWVNDAQYDAVPGENFSAISNLNAILVANHVIYYEKALPFAETPELHKIHEIRCSHYGNIDNVINDLNTSFTGTFDRFSKFEIMDSVYVYDPIDWMWIMYADDWLWHLKRIQADYAWDITRGDPEIKIAIIDYDFDVTHPDLASEIIPHNDPYTGYQYTCNTTHWHGTTVASFASAETTEQGGTSQGQLASVGFNTKIIGYMSSSRQDNLAKALHACNVMGADVMVSCAGGSLCCYPDPNSGEELIVKEILDNGMSIVMPAGNGPNGTSCGPPGNQHAFYPFSPDYDDRIIIVTSTDFNDNHYWEDSQGVEHTHSHFPEVDICSPGYNIMGAGQTECGNEPWPYFGSYGGTSFSSPIVAGVVSLLKSINEDFTPAEIQEFIKRTADPVTDGQNYQGLIGAGRINAFAAVDLAANCTPEVITGNEIWTDDKVLLCGITLEDGAELTIQSTVKLSHRSKIVVKRGGKLTIDGGIIKSLDNLFWLGIEVWGNSERPQVPTYQGWVSLINGGTIENSEMGIYTNRPNDGDGWVKNYTGGIIQADEGSTFRNNRVSVQFFGYVPQSASWFKNCSFVTDDDYLGSEAPEYFMEVSGINGVSITKCDFKNQTSTQYYQSGIYSYHSQIIVEGTCLAGNPCSEWDYGLFDNLHYGIYAIATGPDRYVDIRHTEFNLNNRGLYIGGMTGARVTSNSFNTDAPFNPLGGYCMYLDYSTGYWVEDNDFGHEGEEETGVGIIVNQSGREANEIYRNRFTNLTQGISAQECNTGVTEGLQILCNEYDGCSADIAVLVEGSSDPAGIFESQGIIDDTITGPAGNQFSWTGPHGVPTDINNNGQHFFYYYPSNEGGPYHTEPKYFTTNTVTKQESDFTGYWDPEQGCPSCLGTGGGGTGGIGEMRSEMISAGQDIESIENTLAFLVDGGNTGALSSEVLSSLPPEALEVYSALMGKSPWLSDTVVSSAIEKEEVLPNVMIRDIMVANPQSAKSDALMEKIDQRTEPMPEYMKAQILQGKTIVTVLEELQSKLGTYKLDWRRAFQGLARHFIMDTLTASASLDSLIQIFMLTSDASGKYSLALLHLVKGEYSEGMTVLNAMPAQFAFTGADLAAHQNMLNFFTLAKGILEAGQTYQQADSSQVAQFKTIESNLGGMGSVYARNVLLALNEITYDEPILVPDLQKSTEGLEGYEDLLESPQPARLTIKPNPSKEFIIVSYHAETAGPLDGMITIRDMSVKKIFTMSITENKGEFIVNTSGWKPGMYLASFSIRGKEVESAKFTITD